MIENETMSRITKLEMLNIPTPKTSPLPLRVKVAVLTPITWPNELISGPPEFPVQIHNSQIDSR